MNGHVTVEFEATRFPRVAFFLLSLLLKLEFTGVRPHIMSAQVYPPQNYYKVPQIPIGPPRRAPLANVVGHPHNQPKATPPKLQEKQQKPKEPASPPLPRQNSKTVPPSPPKLIRARDTRDDNGKIEELKRVGFLGEVRYTAFASNCAHMVFREDLPEYTRSLTLVVHDLLVKSSRKARSKPRKPGQR